MAAGEYPPQCYSYPAEVYKNLEPLYLWLPDAMEGPTPVSALIHAATMVTAGVYLMCRISPVLEVSKSYAPTVIAIVGALTALYAATVAVSQNDIKKVLAYSTVSQLGYMFLAVGSGAYVAAIFHMVTHAFFKALLFLGSGSVIHAMHEEQDIQKMGGLSGPMPATYRTFLVAALAIAGIPPFAGFFSKEAILHAAHESNSAISNKVFPLTLEILISSIRGKTSKIGIGTASTYFSIKSRFAVLLPIKPANLNE